MLGVVPQPNLPKWLLCDAYQCATETSVNDAFLWIVGSLKNLILE